MSFATDTAASGAYLSADGLYRYRLWRQWDDGDLMVWVMLNPSTADAAADDPTIRRCMGFARREGYAGIEVINLYALRCTKPKHLLDHPDPEGPDNSHHWDQVLSAPNIGKVVAAWGAAVSGDRLPGSRALGRWFRGHWCCLGVTAGGYPRHPLYVKSTRAFEALP